MTDLQQVPAVDPVRPRTSAGALFFPGGGSSQIPAHEIDDLISSINAELEELQAQVVEAVAAAERAASTPVRPTAGADQVSRIGELQDALVQVELLGTVQIDRAVEAAHAHAAALVAEARATADDLVLQAHVDRASRLASLEVPPRGPVLAIQAAPPTPSATARANATRSGWTPLDPAQEAQEARRFVEFWGDDRTMEHPDVDSRRDELAAIAIGVIGALVLILVALVWLG